MDKQENTISERLNAIADALETASKQARLLAVEVNSGFNIDFDSESIARVAVKAIDDKERANRASSCMTLT